MIEKELLVCVVDGYLQIYHRIFRNLNILFISQFEGFIYKRSSLYNSTVTI